MDYRTVINNELSEAASTLQQFISSPDTVANIQRASSVIAGSIIAGGKVISCGNGGSHCDAMHFAEELSGRFRDDRKALPAVCISDASHITCVGNDYGFEFVFSRFVEGLGKSGDVLFVLSTSGNSKNVINAAEAAKKAGMKVVALTGKDGGKLGPLADVEIRVSHKGYSDRIQEIHIKVIHILILLVEKQVL
jgi:D-sedoheptulose 7-phosphate isomerase